MSVAAELRKFFASQQQKSVAKILHISPQHWNDVLNGRRAVSIELARKIEDAYPINARHILHRQLDEQIKLVPKRRKP